MVFNWFYKKEMINRIPNGIKFDVDNDYLNEASNCCTFMFYSYEDLMTVIKTLYPYASFILEIDLTSTNIFVEEFKTNHYILKEN